MRENFTERLRTIDVWEWEETEEGGVLLRRAFLRGRTGKDGRKQPYLGRLKGGRSRLSEKGEGSITERVGHGV